MQVKLDERQMRLLTYAANFVIEIETLPVFAAWLHDHADNPSHIPPTDQIPGDLAEACIGLVAVLMLAIEKTGARAAGAHVP